MFQQLAARLQEAIDRLRGRGRITEEDLKGTLREIRRALIEADVNLEVARAFVEEVRERALGRKVLESLTPAEVVLATVYEALKEALGGEPKHPQLKDRNVWFLVGLQGSGKTTTAAKLALYYKGKGRRPLLVAADTQRPAAREQLRVLGEKVGVPVLEVQDGESPESIRRRVEERARLEVRDLVLVDTAGRLQIDERLMEELVRLKAALRPDEVLLVLDAMTGQEALSVAQAFDERVGVTGLVLTKLDVLTGIGEIPICVAYDVDGERFDEMPLTQSQFHHAEPIFETMPAWDEDITGCTSFEELPQKAKDYVLRLEELSGAPMSYIGVGPGRDQTIVRNDVLAR